MTRISLTYAQERCVRLAGKLMQQTEMIRPGARIGVAVSGGVDSFVMLKVLLIRQRIVPFRFDVLPLHVNPGFAPESHAPLVEWLADAGVEGHVEVCDHGPRAHSPENRKRSACFYCAMLRRKRLFELCRERELTHLAFGHNAEDQISTFFMNLFQTGKADGMSYCEPFFQGRLTVIRPLMGVEKKLIKKAAEQWQLPIWNNPCPSAGKTRRSEILDEVEALCRPHKGRRKNMLNGLFRMGLERALRGRGSPDDQEGAHGVRDDGQTGREKLPEDGQ